MARKNLKFIGLTGDEIKIDGKKLNENSKIKDLTRLISRQLNQPVKLIENDSHAEMDYSKLITEVRDNIDISIVRISNVCLDNVFFVSKTEFFAINIIRILIGKNFFKIIQM